MNEVLFYDRILKIVKVIGIEEIVQPNDVENG